MQGKEIPVSEMSAPRLQLRWEANPDAESRYEWLCHYEIVIPLGEHDIRREIYDEDGEEAGERAELVAALSGPSKRGSTNVPCVAPDGSGYFDAPYRDGAHAKWDSAALAGIPIYAIAPDGTMFIQPSNG